MAYRISHEFYPTPAEATKALLSQESFTGSIWEPACGNGQISEVLIDAGHHVVSTDLIDHGFGYSGLDFLKVQEPLGKHIITNPPYGSGLADKFLLHALSLTQQTEGAVAMFLNMSSLCHPLRTPLFVQHPPAAIYSVDDIVCWPTHTHGKAPFTSQKQRYCWVVWKPSHTGPTTFWWLSGRDFR